MIKHILDSLKVCQKWEKEAHLVHTSSFLLKNDIITWLQVSVLKAVMRINNTSRCVMWEVGERSDSIKVSSQNQNSSNKQLQLEVKKTQRRLSWSAQLHQVRTNWADGWQIEICVFYSNATTNWHFLQVRNNLNVVHLMPNLQEETNNSIFAIAVSQCLLSFSLLWNNS